MSDLPDGFFDEFWEHVNADEDDGTNAVRLLGEMFATTMIWRDGDDLVAGDDGVRRLSLSREDQFLVRAIEEAAEAGRAASWADDQDNERGWGVGTYLIGAVSGRLVSDDANEVDEILGSAAVR